MVLERVHALTMKRYGGYFKLICTIPSPFRSVCEPALLSDTDYANEVDDILAIPFTGQRTMNQAFGLPRGPLVCSLSAPVDVGLAVHSSI